MPSYTWNVSQINGWNRVSFHDKWKSPLFFHNKFEWGRQESLPLPGEDTGLPRFALFCPKWRSQQGTLARSPDKKAPEKKWTYLTCLLILVVSQIHNWKSWKIELFIGKIWQTAFWKSEDCRPVSLWYLWVRNCNAPKTNWSHFCSSLSS